MISSMCSYSSGKFVLKHLYSQGNEPGIVWRKEKPTSKAAVMWGSREGPHTRQISIISGSLERSFLAVFFSLEEGKDRVSGSMGCTCAASTWFVPHEEPIPTTSCRQVKQPYLPEVCRVFCEIAIRIVSWYY